MVSATTGVTTLSLAGYASWSEYGSIWVTWWLGDVAGALLIAPLILAWTSTAAFHWGRGQWLEAELLLLVLGRNNRKTSTTRRSEFDR